HIGPDGAPWREIVGIAALSAYEAPILQARNGSADEASHACRGSGRVGERVAAVRLLTRELALPAELLERLHDIVAMRAAQRRHQLLEIFRPVLERHCDRGEALAGIGRRLGHAMLHFRGTAERHGEIEAGL